LKILEGRGKLKKLENDDLIQNLEFLGLDLEKIPKFLKDVTLPIFNTSKINNNDSKVYKFVPIDKIEILLTPHLRSDDIKEKYDEAVPLKYFLENDGDEEEIALFKTFSKIVRNMSLEEIAKLEKKQEEFSEKVPFKVKYNKDHLWQIYYSEKSDKYFMLVCTKEQTFSEFLFLLKEQIEFSKKRKGNSPKLYVPIKYVEYSETILKKSEIADLENYLWLFTKNWPLIFEVYDEQDVPSLQIVGETFVYKNIKSNYKVVLDNSEDAIKFYKLMKALFILQTEIKDQYNFETRIDSNNSLSMNLAKVEITFESLTNFIKNEFLLADYEIKNQNQQIIDVKKQLEELKDKVKQKEDEYLQKQKEISTYLECRKTFIGKVKYFFKSSKKSKKVEENQNFDNIAESKISNIDVSSIKSLVEEKEFYTIEDLVTIYSLHERGQKNYKDLKQDIKSLELKLENLNSKVKNANLYIEEIDNHKKSIFEFWKFANKDEKLALEMAEDDKDGEQNLVKKSFDFDLDFETLGEEADVLQRKKLSNEENDSVFIAGTEVLYLINMIRENKIVKFDFENTLENLKEEFNEERLVISSETFDIFGNITESNNKVKYIGSKSHRENEKNKFKILNINKQVDVFDFTEKMQSIVNYLEGAIPKITSFYDMTLYKLVPISKNIVEQEFDIYNINVEKELESYKASDQGAYNLICLNYKEGMPLIYYTNAMFFDNTNKTLPLGMNLSTKVLIDNSRLDFVLANKTKFRTNSYFNDNDQSNLKSKDIFVYEYDVLIKEEKTEEAVEELILEDNEVEIQEISKDNYEEEIIDDDSEIIIEEENEDNMQIEEKTFEKDVKQEQFTAKSKKLLKLQQKLEKELEKEKKKEARKNKKIGDKK